MTPALNIAARLALVVTAGVIVQISAVSQITVLGATVDLSPLLVASAGLLCGATMGAICGFSAGLLVDMALVTTLGVSSLIYTGVGYGAGRLRELRDPGHSLTPVAVGAAATGFALLGYSLVQFLLGIEAPVSLLLVREILATVVANTLIALPVFAVMRRVLAPALPEDPRRRRRRAYTTGGLSPLSRA